MEEHIPASNLEQNLQHGHELIGNKKPFENEKALKEAWVKGLIKAFCPHTGRELIPISKLKPLKRKFGPPNTFMFIRANHSYRVLGIPQGNTFFGQGFGTINEYTNNLADAFEALNNPEHYAYNTRSYYKMWTLTLPDMWFDYNRLMDAGIKAGACFTLGHFHALANEDKININNNCFSKTIEERDKLGKSTDKTKY